MKSVKRYTECKKDTFSFDKVLIDEIYTGLFDTYLQNHDQLPSNCLFQGTEIDTRFV